MWSMMFFFYFSVCSRGCGPKWGDVGGKAKSKKRYVGLA